MPEQSETEIELVEYPYPSGNYVVLGPECFTDGDVISYLGENYYRACGHKVAELDDGGESSCVRRTNHPGKDHEDYDGRIYNEIYGTTPETIELPVPAVGMGADGALVHVTQDNIRDAWRMFIEPTQRAGEPMTDETRTVAAILRAVNGALPVVTPKEESDEA